MRHKISLKLTFWMPVIICPILLWLLVVIATSGLDPSGHCKSQI